MGTGLVEGMGASTTTLCVAAEAAEAMVLNITSAPSKKPSMGMPMEVESSLTMGRYMEIGSSSSWKIKVTSKNEEQRKL